MKRPIGIDLFAGVGGLSLGFEQAGFEIAAAVEIDPIHACAHLFNFPKCAVLTRSVSDLSGEQIREAANLKGKRIDVVFGGAPCQGFSLMGKRALDDPRNSLVRDFVRLVVELDAQYFVFENVKGLTFGKHRRFLEEFIQAFEDVGYSVRQPWMVLNASAFGVPQERERLFILGAKKRLPLPQYPSPTTATQQDVKDIPQTPTCFEALGDLPDAESFKTLVSKDEVKTTSWGKPSQYARLLRCSVEESWAFGHKRIWDPSLLTSSMRTDHTEISRRRFAEVEPGQIEAISRFFKLDPRGYSNTLRAGTDSARGAFTSPRPIHYQYARCVTVREMARLHSFPDWFRFHQTKWHGARQIGNAVPPFLACAVAGGLIKAMQIQPTRPTKSLALGVVELLQMDMTQASKFWGIKVPIGGRDRKSGATKRKQRDVELAGFDFSGGQYG